MIEFAIAAAFAVAVQDDAPPAVMRRAVPLGHLNVPDEIARAIIPYVNCLLLSHGVRVGPPGAQTVPSAEELGRDCAQVRSQAARIAEGMLRNQHRGTPRERRAFVERVLADADVFAANAGTPPSISEGKANASNQ